MKKICGSNQSGRSMIEMLGVLAIIGVLSVGGISGYSKAMAKYKVNKALDQISMLIMNIRTLYANQSTYEGLSEETAVTFELVTQEMAGSTTIGSTPTGAVALQNPFGGSVTIDSETPFNTFKITYNGLDSQSCVAIASSDWGGSASSGLDNIKVGTKTFKWSAGADDGTLPITISGAASACGSTTNSITWTYK